MEINREDIEQLRELIDSKPKKIVVVAHANPDGDAIGSSLAWAEILDKKGHQVTCVVPNRYPSFLAWMGDISRIKIYKSGQKEEVVSRVAEAEIIFCMDFNTIARLELLGESISENKRAKVIIIDHHLDPPKKHDIMFSYPKSSSTSYLTYQLIVELEGLDAVTKEMAEALYVGIMTDTGNFSFSFLTSELFMCVAELVRKGIDIPYINSMVYNSFSEDRVRLLGYAINKMETITSGDKKVTYISLDEEELRQFNFQPGDSEGFVNFPLTIGDIAVSAMFVATRNFIRISFRSRRDVNVSEFAKLYFNGGGHKNASGGKSYQTIPETIEYFKKCVLEYFH